MLVHPSGVNLAMDSPGLPVTSFSEQSKERKLNDPHSNLDHLGNSLFSSWLWLTTKLSAGK